MFKNYKGYLPDYVMINRLDEEDNIIGYDIVSFNRLSPMVRMEVMAHQKMFHNVDKKPLYKRIITGSTTIMKYGDAFTKHSLKWLEEYSKKLGYTIAPLINDILGGDSGWGCVHVSATDHAGVILAELGIAEEMYALPKAKFLVRFHKVIGECDVIKYAPRIRIIPDISAYEGLVFYTNTEYVDENGVSSTWFELNKLELGFKCAGSSALKSTGHPLPDHMNFGEYDLIVMESENKIKLSEEKLSRLFAVRRNESPRYRFSRNLLNLVGKLGKNPTDGMDLQALIGRTPSPDLTMELKFYKKGELDAKLFSRMFEYKDKNGVLKVRKEGAEISAGADPFGASRVGAVMAALDTVVMSRLKGRTAGVYGVAMPLSLLPVGHKVKYGWITRWPWMFPIYAKYAIYEHCIYVEDKVHKLFGGDYDGDLIAVYHSKSMNTSMILDRDYDKLAEIMKSPAKEEAPDEKTLNEAMLLSVEQHTACGMVYNNGKIVVEAARMEGWSKDRILELDARIYAQVVQPIISAFKHEGCYEVPNAKEIAAMFMVPSMYLNRAAIMFRAVRSKKKGGIVSMIYAAKKYKADINSRMYYERVAAFMSQFDKEDK